MSNFAIIDYRTSKNIIKGLKNNFIEPIKISPCPHVASAISGHPDIQIFIFKKKVFCHPDIDINFLKKIEKHLEIIMCPSVLSKEYPNDIPYNIAFTGHSAFHKTACTDPVIKNFLLSQNINLINVNQGYSKCSTLIIDRNSIITSDINIHQAAVSNDINSLLIQTGHISLPGYDYGFIGGAAGRVNDTVFFTGKITEHPSFQIIKTFISNAGKELNILSKEPIIDIGSILFF